MIGLVLKTSNYKLLICEWRLYKHKSQSHPTDFHVCLSSVSILATIPFQSAILALIHLYKNTMRFLHNNLTILFCGYSMFA